MKCPKWQSCSRGIKEMTHRRISMKLSPRKKEEKRKGKEQKF